MTTKKITINHGDEYRAKIENDFQKENFFFDSYQRAAKCVSEIVNDKFCYMQSYEKNNNGHAFYDYGNNVVAFCAERGQGKTSAMLSFSGELQRFRNSNSNQTYNNVLEFDFKESCFFEVLESIDPTMINNGVGILKVFLSRLFFHFQTWVNDNIGKNRNFELSNKIQSMLVCFKKCYTNIEYLQNDVSREWDQDNLDMLFQIGDSSNLKNSIHELIESYFEIRYGKKNGFLVVQIDDADLAIGNVSDICENVRKFLKVPGIIVLMAADYEQLKYAFTQKYCKEYEKLIKDNSIFSEKCEKMASKYLEKILPHSHRIELPKLQNMIGEEHTRLIVEYRVNGVTQFLEEFKGCKDIQEQLIKVIYLRTGIILMKNEEKIHPFLPSRLRELTHLIKLLSDMEQVNHNDIFELIEHDQGQIEEIQMLQRNLQQFKSYFMSDWCVNRLNQLEQELIYKINNLKIDESIDGEHDSQIYKLLSEYLNQACQIDKKEKTHKHIINNLIISGLSDQPQLQAALFLYYSIYLNIRFTYAFENEKEYQRIMEWLDYPIEVPVNLKNNKYGNRYHFLHFEFDYNTLKEKLKNNENDGITKSWLELFCRAKPEKDFNAPKTLFVSIKENSEEISEFNQELTKAEFDILQPLNSIFYKRFWKEWRKEVSKDIAQPSDSLEDIVPGMGEMIVRENKEIMLVHRSVKNIIANYDVQRCLMGYIEKEYQYIHLKRDIISWYLSGRDMYADLDTKYKQVFEFLDTSCNLQTVFENFFNVPRVFALVFLGNRDNEHKYLEEYRSRLSGAKNAVYSVLNAIRSSSATQIVENFYLDNTFDTLMRDDMFEFEILGNRSEVADINNKVKHLWDIECEIKKIYDSLVDAKKKGPEEIDRMRENIPEYMAILSKYRSIKI